MAVKVIEKKTGKAHAGKYAVVQPESVFLYSGIMADKKGGFRGCGKRTVFVAGEVEVAADDPAREVKRS